MVTARGTQRGARIDVSVHGANQPLPRPKCGPATIGSDSVRRAGWPFTTCDFPEDLVVVAAIVW